jgi:hypothetical protein
METWYSKLQRRLSILRQLARPDRRFQFLRIFLFMLAVPWLLKLRLPRLRALLGTSTRQKERDAELSESIIQDVDSALRIGWPFVRSRCLSRGITLYYFLRRAGFNVGLCFGVANNEDDPLAGHCWLVRGGEPMSEPTDPRLMYTSVYSFPEGT